MDNSPFVADFSLKPPLRVDKSPALSSIDRWFSPTFSIQTSISCVDLAAMCDDTRGDGNRNSGLKHDTQCLGTGLVRAWLTYIIDIWNHGDRTPHMMCQNSPCFHICFIMLLFFGICWYIMMIRGPQYWNNPPRYTTAPPGHLVRSLGVAMASPSPIIGPLRLRIQIQRLSKHCFPMRSCNDWIVICNNNPPRNNKLLVINSEKVISGTGFKTGFKNIFRTGFKNIFLLNIENLVPQKFWRTLLWGGLLLRLGKMAYFIVWGFINAIRTLIRLKSSNPSNLAVIEAIYVNIRVIMSKKIEIQKNVVIGPTSTVLWLVVGF